MDEEAPDGGNQYDEHGDKAPGWGQRACYSQNVGGNNTTQSDEDIVDRMSARTGQEIDVFGAVMDGVEAPQKRDLVRPPVAPIETNLADYQPHEDALPKRPSRDGGLHAEGNQVADTQRDKGKRERKQQAWHQTIEEIIPQILGKSFAEEFLGMKPEEPLKRQKDKSEQQQPKAQAYEFQHKCKNMLLIQQSRQGVYQWATVSL